MEKKKRRKMKNSIFYFPQDWIELNPADAKSATHVVICESCKLVGIFYTTCECSELSDTREEEIIQLAVSYGFNATNTHLFGLISEEYLSRYNQNLGNAIIKKR